MIDTKEFIIDQGSQAIKDEWIKHYNSTFDENLDDHENAWWLHELGGNMAFTSTFKNHTTGATDATISAFNYMEDAGLLDDRSALDLGSGEGAMVSFLRRKYGIDVNGIEIDPGHAFFSNLVINKIFDSRGDNGKRPIVACGNYLDHLECKKDPALYHRDVVEQTSYWVDRDYSKYNRNSHIGKFYNPYGEIGIPFNETDIFYIYQFPNNTPPSIEHISKFAKVGAYAIVTNDPNEIHRDKIRVPEHPTNLQVVETFGHGYPLTTIFQKTHKL